LIKCGHELALWWGFRIRESRF